MAEGERVLRTQIYIQRPREYEIAPCECGNVDPDWSEFEGHLWCEKCQKDFVPEHGGIFDGPIPVHMSALMGTSFDRVDIETGEIIAFLPPVKR